jgi:CubicO group peptidase (beta-lactamase class C family)
VKSNKKIIILRLLGAIVTVTSIYFFAPWQFALYYLTPLPSSVQEQTEEAIEQGLDGIIVYIDKRGQPPEHYANGWHNRDKKIPAYHQALFKIASIGKLYNAASLAKLVAQEKIALNNTVGYYLPELVGRIENANKITIKMVVQHRSGIPNFTDTKDFDWSKNHPDLLQLVLDKPADFEPNTEYSYSNTNYVLLSKIMTKSLGYDHTQFIKSEILDPLQLENTYFSVKDIELETLMSGYYVGYDDDFKTLEQGYVASAEDVGIFLRALNNGDLFSAQEKDIYASLYEYSHTGWVLGYSSIARYHKDIDTVLIQFVNTTGNDTVLLNKIIYHRLVQTLQKRDM